ncbi:MAG: hypothetical protein PHH36_08950 [Sideroxydans sp.]|nr:hypothetical protein [Sideroxydans sp.]
MDIDRGRCLEGSCVEGIGLFDYIDGKRYAGEFKLGEPHGNGVMVWPNGDRYEGSFKFGKRHGSGRMIYSSGLEVKQVWYLDRNADTARKELEAKQYAERVTGNGDDAFQWGKLVALAMGAAAGGMGHLDSATQVQLAGGMVADSMPGQQGISNTQSALNQRLEALKAEPGAASDGAVTSPQKAALRHYHLAYTCPSGAKLDTDVPYRTDACLQVKIEFAKVMACNEAGSFQRVQQNCQRVCGDMNCSEK